MYILAVDTSGPVAGVAITKDDTLCYEGIVINKKTHSVNLLPMVEEALTRAGLDIAEIDAFASVVGPGSFTGVRLGVNTIRGMAHGAGKPAIAVDALEAIAAGVSTTQACICPLQDARAGQVYASLFTADMPPIRMMPNVAMPLTEFLAQAQALTDAPLLFAGDGMAVHKESIIAQLGERAQFAPAHIAVLRPSSVALLAYHKRDSAVDYLQLLPTYLRAPQAERARLAKEQANG